MPPIEPSRISQTSVARGMFRSVAPELIPQNAAYDILNGLLDEDGTVYKRGGSEYISDAVGADLQFIWSGWLAGGQETLVATDSDLFTVAGGVATVVPGSGGVNIPRRAVVMDGIMYFPGGQTYDGTTIGVATESATYYASVANRLLAADGDRIKFSQILDPTTFDPTDYHQLPGGVQILGIEGLRDAAVVFSTEGIYIIGNLAFNLTDDQGNVQQTVDRYSADFTLWGEAGIAGWSGSLIVPGLDGVWIMSLGLEGEAPQSFQKISAAVDDLYRDYVAQGCTPGLAAVHRSHYVLPILQGDEVVDVLVCRLDGQDENGPTFPWVHMAGLSAARCYASHLEDTASQLIAAAGEIAMQCRWFQPGTAFSLDADDSIPEFKLVTRDYATGPLNKNTVLKVRLRYDMRVAGNPAPVISASVGLSQFVGTTWGLFDWGEADWTAPGDSFAVLEGGAPVDVGAVAPFAWRVGRKVEFVRFIFRCVDDTAVLSVRGIEVFVRDAGRV